MHLHSTPTQTLQLHALVRVLFTVPVAGFNNNIIILKKIIIMITRSTGTVHTSAQARLTSVAIWIADPVIR